MDLEKLETLGLSKGEVKVYTAILDIGKSAINNIHERTGFERRAIYDILNKLIEKGFISYTVEDGKRTYQCTHPSKIKQESLRLQTTLKEIDHLVPEMIRTYEMTKPTITSEVYRGKEGIKALFENMLNHKDNYFIGGGWYLVNELPHFWANYNRRRIAGGVRWHNLVRNEFKHQPPLDKKLMAVKFLPAEFSVNPIVVFIFGDNVATVSWGKEIFAFVIQSKEVSENYKVYHKYLWQNVAHS